jgi:hypothetical protein
VRDDDRVEQLPGDPGGRTAFGSRRRIGKRGIAIGEVANREFKIERARLINARYRDNEVTIVGAFEITLSVGVEVRLRPGEDFQIPVFDGCEQVGVVNAKCPGNRDFWIMSSVHILLPGPSIT